MEIAGWTRIDMLILYLSYTCYSAHTLTSVPPRRLNLGDLQGAGERRVRRP